LWPAGVSFAFDNESGQSDKQPTTALAQLFPAGVQWVFISDCKVRPGAGSDVLGGMALGLVSLGAPLMIGWTASVLHDVATELAERFYGAMTTGQADRSGGAGALWSAARIIETPG
jgi:hypothetical protein